MEKVERILQPVLTYNEANWKGTAGKNPYKSYKLGKDPHGKTTIKTLRKLARDIKSGKVEFHESFFGKYGNGHIGIVSPLNEMAQEYLDVMKDDTGEDLLTHRKARVYSKDRDVLIGHFAKEGIPLGNVNFESLETFMWEDGMEGAKIKVGGEEYYLPDDVAQNLNVAQDTAFETDEIAKGRYGTLLKEGRLVI